MSDTPKKRPQLPQQRMFEGVGKETPLNLRVVTEAFLAALPPAVTAFVIGDAFGLLALGSALAAGAVKAGRVHKLNETVEEALRDLDDVTEHVEELGDYIDVIEQRLSPRQQDHVRTLIHESLATAEEEWAEHLRRALKNTIRSNIEDDTRHAVLVNLRALRPAHIRCLHQVANQNGKMLKKGVLFSPLYTVGFLEKRQSDTAVWGTDLTVTFITDLGRAALALLAE